MTVSSSRKLTQILGAELDKLVKLPLIWLTLLGTFILNLVGLASMGYLQAGFIILGILATCSEYSGGQI